MQSLIVLDNFLRSITSFKERKSNYSLYVFSALLNNYSPSWGYFFVLNEGFSYSLVLSSLSKIIQSLELTENRTCHSVVAEIM